MQRIESHGLSRRGRAHDDNQDHYAIATLNKSLRLHRTNLTLDDDTRVHGNNQGHLFLVADGLGSGTQPDRASGVAIDSIVTYVLNEMPLTHMMGAEPEDVRIALMDAVRNAQTDLRRRSTTPGPDMGATLTLAFLCWPDLYIGHVGNGRAYLHREGDLERLTTDHTVAEVRAQIGGQVEPAKQPVLWNALGGRTLDVHPEVQHFELRENDTLLLVTDGVARERDESRIRAVLEGNGAAEELCQNLVDVDGQDDRTAIVVRCLPTDRSGCVETHVDPSALEEGSQEPVPSMLKRIGRAILRVPAFRLAQ
mgnify:FL=1